MIDQEQTRRDAPTGIVAELREWKRRALEAEHSLVQAERERDEARKYHAEDSRAWKKRCDVAEARLAKVPALVEALKDAERNLSYGPEKAGYVLLLLRRILTVWEQG